MAIKSKGKKELDIAISTPTAGIVQAAYALCLPRMILHFLQVPVLAQEYSSKRVRTQMRLGANIGEARDQMVEDAISNNCTHVLFIDDDMGFAADTLNVALSRQMPIILGNYRRKLPPGLFTAVKKDKDENVFEIETTAEKTSLEECYYGGFGFALFETDVFRQIAKPRFLMTYVPEVDRYTTEDYPFFMKVHEKGIPVFCDHEVSKRLWHNGTFAYSYDQKLDPQWAFPPGNRIG